MAGAKEPSVPVEGAPEAAENADYQRSGTAASLASDPGSAAPLLACSASPNARYYSRCDCIGCFTEAVIEMENERD